jgi:hypothetical protein
MSLIEIGREMIERNGGNTRGMSRLKSPAACCKCVRPATWGLSDFSALLSNVAGRRLRSAYEQAASTYRVWAAVRPMRLTSRKSRWCSCLARPSCYARTSMANSSTAP